jgi:hypothetical protein
MPHHPSHQNCSTKAKLTVCGGVPFVAGSAASPHYGNATLPGSRLALSVSSTLDVAQGNRAKAPALQVMTGAIDTHQYTICQ